MGSECLFKPDYADQATPGSDNRGSGNHLLPNLLQRGLWTLRHDFLEEPLSEAVFWRECRQTGTGNN